MSLIPIIILGLFTGWVLYVGLNLSMRKTGPINNLELNVTMAIIGNKIVGAIFIVGSMMTWAIILS